MTVQLKLLIFVKLLNNNFYFCISNVKMLENERFNNLLIKMFQFFFFFMLIMFDFNLVVKVYCVKNGMMLTKIKIIHSNKSKIYKNKNEIHKNKNNSQN